MREKISNLSSVRTQRRSLRTNATPQEVILWSRIKNAQLGYKFRRQHSFGKYIADFYCPGKQLVVEVDGSQHMEQEKYDAGRTAFFESLGLKILRFWNNEVNMNIDGVDENSRIFAIVHPTSVLPSKEGRRHDEKFAKNPKKNIIVYTYGKNALLRGTSDSLRAWARIFRLRFSGEAF